MAASGDGEPEDSLLVRYLLDELPDEDTQRFDELSVVDEAFASRLRAAEYDLVDAFLRGELSGAALDRFRTHYLTRPFAAEKVTFARTLLAYRGAPTGSSPELSRTRTRQTWLLTPQWAVAAVTILALAAAGYFWSEHVRLRRAASEARAGTTTNPPLPETARQPAASPQLRAETPPARAAFAFVLYPARRGVADVPTMTAPRDKPVTLRLVLEFNDFERYAVEVRKTGSGRIVSRATALIAEHLKEGDTVSTTIPASRLEAGRYVVDVTGLPAKGAPQSVGSYPLRVVLQ